MCFHPESLKRLCRFDRCILREVPSTGALGYRDIGRGLFAVDVVHFTRVSFQVVQFPGIQFVKVD